MTSYYFTVEFFSEAEKQLRPEPNWTQCTMPRSVFIFNAQQLTSFSL